MTIDWWPSPAKLNLFLHILGRYDSGYHQLQTLFQILDWGDRLAFAANNSGKIRLLSELPGVEETDNLIYRAANMLKTHCNVNHGVDIAIEKQLPMGGGIGGGSSNAATTLVALNFYWQCGLSTEELAQLGLQLGADVPIFVHGKTAFAGGVGEEVYPVELEQKYYLIAFPNVHVSTAEVFGHPNLPRNTAKIAWNDYSFDTTGNDCQEIVCKCQPEVANLLQWLLHYAPSRMTGTGACVFAQFSSPEQLQEVRQALPEKWSGYTAKSMNISPLLLKLEQVSFAQTT